jgi:hypothetical protein
VPTYTAHQDWTAEPTQQSIPILLKAGHPYYIEVLHKQGTGGYNLSVAWEGPGITQQVISGDYLSSADFMADTPANTSLCTDTVGIYREYWNDVPGVQIKDLTGSQTYPGTPTGTGVLIAFEGSEGFEDYENYGERYRGYLCPPNDGRFTFWVAGDDVAELYLSTDTDPLNKTLIASVSKPTAHQDWTAESSQQSIAITLKAGQPYYIEVLHKQGTGAYNLSVAWAGPGFERQVINGKYLSVDGFAQGLGDVQTSLCTDTVGIYREYWNDVPGVQIKDLTGSQTYPGKPSGTGTLITFEGAYGFEDYQNYGERYRGYLCPPADGTYTFWVAADDVANLYLSMDTDPYNKMLIASVSKATDHQDWTAEASQQSVAINLKGGRPYYIEVLHKQGTGGYNLSVAWEGPGITQQVITGEYLSVTGLENTIPISAPAATPAS